MEFVWEGFQLGLLLTIMMGPILFAIIQSSIEEGFIAGAIVGAGIWFSDILYILFVYYGVSYVDKLLQNQSLMYSLAYIGCVILLIIGIGTFLSKAPTFEAATEQTRRSSFFNLFTRGFLVNTVNPFTIFFWFSVTSTKMITGTFDQNNAVFFFGAIMITIICTDLLKAYLAKWIGKKLTQKHIAWTRKITGVLLFLFGVGLFFRVYYVGF